MIIEKDHIKYEITEKTLKRRVAKNTSGFGISQKQENYFVVKSLKTLGTIEMPQSQFEGIFKNELKKQKVIK